MTNSHNHFNQDNPLVSDLVNPLTSELGEDSVLINIENSDSAYGDLISKDSDELSLIEKAIEAQKQNDYEQSVFNNSSAKFTFNFGNYGNNYSHQGSPYTGDRNEQHTVNQNAILNQVDDFGEEIVAQGTGLTGEYFNEANLTNPILTRTDTNIDFDWKKGSPDSAIAKDTFSVRWTGQIEATQDETYTFYTQADDGVRLWVNNQLIIDDWKQHSLSERSGIIDLEAGQFYDIKLEYFENKGDAAVSLLWSSPNQNKEVIPTSFLYPEDYVPTVSPKVESEPTTLQLETKNNNSFSIMAEGQVRVNGSSDFDGDPGDKRDDALIYAGQGFTFNGNIVLPVQRDEAGNAITDANNKEILVDKAVAVSQNYLQLNANNSSNRYSGLVPPQIVDSQIVEVPEYGTLKSENLASAIPDNASIIDFDIRSNRMNNLNQWQQKFPAPGTIDNPTVVRISRDGLNIPSNVDLSNYVIIVEQGDINFNGSGHDLDNVVLVAENGNINLGNVKADDSRIFASNTINMNGGARFSGQSLIANGRGNITFDGATATVEDTDFLTVVSAGDITFNGASATRGQFLTANNFTFNGHSTLYGSIGAKHDITFNGNAEVIATDPPSISVNNLTIIEGDDGTKSALVTVNLSQGSIFSTELDYITEDDTATAGIDYEAANGQLIFKPLETSKSIIIPIIGDRIDEIDEAFTIKLNHVQSTVTIIDDDEPSLMSVGDISVVEGNNGTSNVSFTVNLDKASGKEITVDYATADATAISGEDYQGISGSLTFEPGETSKTVLVGIAGDIIDEFDETFSFSLSNASNAIIDSSTAIATIINDDLSPQLTVEDTTVIEGNNGTNLALFTVSLDNPSSKEISIDYATADGTATAGVDYEATSGTLTFAPGLMVQTVSIPIIGDTIDEIDEAFFLNFNNSSNVVVSDGQSQGIITDDDAPPEIAAENISITEGDDGTRVASITVSLSTVSSKEISVDYATADGTTVAGSDYLQINGTLNFAPGEISKTIEVPIIGDILDEIDEVFLIDFSNPSNITLTGSQNAVTIIDDDEPPVISIDSVVVEESDTDTTAVLTVTLDAPSNLPITVKYSTADETAVASEDYQAKDGIIIFEPGETTKTIPLTVIGDLGNETDETFAVNLSNPSNATIAKDKGTVTIEDDDRRKGILLVEEDNFSVQHSQVIDIPATASVLSITYSELNFDINDTNSINDALEVALVDNNGNSLVHTIGSKRDALFNLTEGEAPDLATGVTFEGQTIKVNLSDIAPNTPANLIVRLVNNDGDVNTSVRLTGISLELGEDIKPVAIAEPTATINNDTPIDFDAIEDVSASLTPIYGQTSFNEDTKTLYADIAVKNQGGYEVRERLLVAVKNISDPTVRAINFDGLTPDGVPYYDLSHLIDGGILDSSEVTAEGTIAFVNQGKVQFDYDLVFLSQLNRAPEFTTEADTEALAGKPYSYDAGATDPDNDVLSYSLLSAPVGMEINPQTGEITWTPSVSDLGNHAVTVQTEDGRGGEATQVYNLSVVDNVPNRPPVFTSTPIVDGRINQPYSYDSDAVDADGDLLTYSLLDAPEGLSIDSETGEISWTPNGEQLGTSLVSIQTKDGRGGIATQNFEVLIQPEAGNNAPIITSNPFTKFNLPGISNLADGDVTPNLIDLDLVLGESITKTVSLTLPELSSGQSFADIVFVVDESGSMGGEQAWIRNMVLDLETALQAEGVGENRYGLVGYGGASSHLRGHAHLVGGELLGTAAEFADAANSLVLNGGTEDGYDAFDFGLDYPFRDGAAVNFILVTDEDRDVVDSSLNFTNILESFNAESALLNAVVGSSFRSSNNQTALGVDFEGNAYIADGAGNFISSPNGIYVSGAGTTKRDYVDLAWVVEGAAWDLNQLRAGGLTATSFTQAFVAIKAQEIQAQLPIDLISSDPSVSLTNLTGELSGLGGGDTATFDVEITGDGTARSFDLLLVRPDTNIVLGSIPVTINNDYFYPVKAIDADGDILSYSLTSAPEGANIDTATGNISWEPPADGDYDFTVEVSDGRGGIDTQAYTVTVTAGTVNVNPVIDSAAPIEALLNQSFTYNVEASDPDGDFLGYYLDDAPDGMTIDRTTGQISWIPDISMSGSQSVTVRVLDGRGGEATQTFTLEVGADLANSAPQFDSTPLTSVEINQTYRYDATATDPDNDSLRYELALAPDGMNIESSTGRLFWQPSADNEGTHTIVIKVADGRGGIDLQAFSLSVGQKNVNPVITSEANATALVSSAYQYRVRAQDSDGKVVSYRLDNAPDGMSINEKTGIIDWTPTAQQLGVKSVSVTAIDDQGGEATQTFELKVVETAANQAPTITSSPRTVTQLDSPYFYSLKATDPNGDRLTYSVVSAPEGMTVDETGLVTWLPNSQQFGENQVTLQVDDGKGLAIQQSFTINVVATNSNSLPTITSTPQAFGAVVGQTYSYDATATDPDGDLLLWSLDAAPNGMSIDPQTGTLRWQPTIDQIGSHIVAVRVIDALGAYVGQEFTLNVTGINTPASIVSTPITNGSANQLYTYQVTGTDAENDSLTYGLGVYPEGMTINPNTGAINWTPTVGGSYDVEVLIFDSQGGSNKQVFTLEIESEAIDSTPTITTTPTVTEGNTSPLISSTPITNGAVNQAYTYQVTATDAENNILTYGFASRPESMSIDPDTGEITWTPAVGGNYDIEVLVFDDKGARTSQEFTIDVQARAVNTAPTITSSPSYVGDVNTDYSYQVVGEDKEGDTLSYELIAAPGGMNIDAANGAVTWTNPVLGTHQVVIGVKDGQAGVAQGYTLTVKENLAPVINLSSPPNPTAIPGKLYSYDIPAYDPNGDRLFYSLDSASTDKGITIDRLGRLRWTPDISNAGNHTVTVTITDEAGAEIEQSFNIGVVADTVAPKVTLNPGNIYVVDGQFQADINSTVLFQAWATDNVGVTGLQLLVNNTPVAVDVNGIANVTFAQLGRIELKAIATDAAGNVGEATATVDVYDFSDVDAPTVSLDLSSIEDNIVTAPFDIIGTINDDNLDYYVLEVRPADGVGEFREIFRSSSPVTDGVIATFDPTTLANDAYTLRVTAVDTGGNFARSEETVYVEGELKLGNFQLSFTDLVVPVAGIPISVTRTYDTLTANSQDDFGYGWRLEFRDTNLRTSVGVDEQFDIFGLTSKGFSEGDAVYITLPGGKRETFIFKPQLTPSGALLQGLAGSGGYAAGGKDYGLYNPKFVSESDSNNKLEVSEFVLVRSESGQFAGIAGGLYNPSNSYYGGKYKLTTGEGIVYEIDAVSGDLLTATDTNGNKLTFSDDGITSDSGVGIKFGRNAQGQITKVIDPDGQEIKYQYDEAGNLVAVTDRKENTTGYGYSEERSHYLDEIVDPLGRTGVKTEYDENGRMSRLIDVNGDAVELNYDTDNSTQTIKDALGNPTTYVYDDKGNVLTEVDPVGLITKRTYDSDNNMLTETIITDESGESGYTTSYTYDENGYETSITDPLGNTERYDYDDFGRMLSRTDALGNTTTYTYSGRNIASVTDALGNVVSYTYDRAGNRTSMTEGENDITYYEYDSRGNRTKKTDALGNVTTYTHDTQGNVLTETMTLTTSEGVRTLVITKTYDSNGNETSVLDAEGNLTQYEYDANNNQTVIIDPLGRRTVNRYDEKNNLIETVLPDNTPDDDNDNLRTSTTYDANGNRTSVTDFAGNTTYYSSSATNLPTGMIYPDATPDDLSDNPTISVAYNKAGGMNSLVNESGNTAEYEYDATGRIIATRQTDADGNLIESRTEYNAAGQVIASTDASGHTIRYVRDALGQVTKTIFHDGTSIKTQYDAYGNEIAKTDQAGVTTYYEYDAEDRLTAVVDALGQRTEYQYDEAGNLVYQKDAKGHITRFEFDGLGRQTGVIRPMGQESLTLYNEVGNVISTTDFNGEVILYEYNTNNQLTAKRFEDGTSVEFNYDNVGRLTSTIDERGTTSYTYNERGNLLSRIEPDGKTISYTYNDAGKLESIITDSVTTTYTYDSFNFLDKVTANGEVTDYDYDLLGNLVQTTLANGVVETREYDELYRLIGVDNTDADGNVISSYDYTLDAVGNRTLVEEFGGRTVAYEYDKLYRLLNEDITDSVNGNQTLSYVYDAVGNRLSLTDSVNGITTYSYNNNDWLLSETSAGVATNYTYDSNGNNLTKISPDEQVTYDWNQENRLIGAEITNALGTTNLGYQYDASGVRVASIVDGEETRYLVDANREHAEVIEEYNPDGTTNVSYVHGLNLISAERSGEADYYINDGHSGVRQLTDENGIVTDSYDYDGYGNLLNSTGSTENNYLYRGEQFDRELGMQYLRQRYYNTSVGRFASVDPFSGLVELPMSRHRYMYGNANPVTYLDPSGEFSSLGEFSVASALQTVLGTLLTTIGVQGYIGQGFRQLSGDLYWDGTLYGGDISAGIGFRGVLLDATTTEPVNTFLSFGPSRRFNGKWLVLTGGIGLPDVLGGQLPTVLVEESVTIKSPRAFGGNAAVFSGGALFGYVGAGNTTQNFFSLGYGVGYFNNVFDDSGANALAGGLIGLSIPIKGTLDDPNPDSYPPFL